MTKLYNTISPRAGNAHGSTFSGYTAADLEEVLDVRRQVELGEWPSSFLANIGGGDDVPELLAARTHLRLNKRRPEVSAMVVTMDKPYSLGMELGMELIARGVEFKEVRPHQQFCDPTFSFTAFLKDLMSANHNALNHIFDVKYHFNALRPEQMLQVDPCLLCANEAGAPNHPSYPAGHGGTSGSAQATIKKYFNLTQDQELMVHDACYQFAHWRTLLGVHYKKDNDEGLRIGNLYSS